MIIKHLKRILNYESETKAENRDSYTEDGQPEVSAKVEVLQNETAFGSRKGAAKKKEKGEIEQQEELLESEAFAARAVKKAELLKAAEEISGGTDRLPLEIRASAIHLCIDQQKIFDNHHSSEDCSALLQEKLSENKQESFEKSLESIGKTYMPDTAITRYDYNEFLVRFLTHRDVAQSEETLLLMFADWLFFCRDAGYDADDYFDYEFYNKETPERMSFVGALMRENLRRTLNKKPAVIGGKGSFLKKYGRFIKRDWIDAGACTEEEFYEFAANVPVFFAKSRRGSGGAGIRRINAGNMSSEEIHKIYEQCRDDNCIVEAAVIQHDAIAEFNSDTVNTIRIVTLAAEDEVHITGAAVRFGRKGGATDNYHQGGVCALLDTATGRIVSEAIDRSGRHYAVHPDSGKNRRLSDTKLERAYRIYKRDCVFRQE